MKRALALLLLLLPLAACQDGAPRFDTMAIALPHEEPAYPDGPGKDAVINNCAACHSADMILNQPKLTRAQWQSNIDKMRKVFKAEIDPAVEGDILDYLTAFQGQNARNQAPKP